MTLQSFAEAAVNTIKAVLLLKDLDLSAEAALAQAAVKEMAEGALMVDDMDLRHIFDDCADLEAIFGCSKPPAMQIGSRIAADPRKTLSDLQEVLA